MSKKLPHVTIDFESYTGTNVNYPEAAARIMAQQEQDDAEALHHLRNFDAIRNRLGQARIDEIFTALVLAFGPPSKAHRVQPGGFDPARTLTAFRDLLKTATGIPFSLNETIPWFKEYRTWFQQQTKRRSSPSP